MSEPIGNGWHLLAPERTEDRPRLTIDWSVALKYDRNATMRRAWAVRKAIQKRDEE